MTSADHSLIGIGMYTPAEAGRLINVAPSKLSRWLKGHTSAGQWYEPLWKPEIDLGDEKLYLGFRDLLEARTAALFVKEGLSSQKVRAAIQLASEVVGERPLSTTWLRTDGQTVFLKVLESDNAEPRLIDLFKNQYVFNSIVERSIRDIDFDGVTPKLWWPHGRRSGILVDPTKAFGQPIEATTSVPAQVLANAATAEGSAEQAAKAWAVPLVAIRRAVAFQRELETKRAA